MWYTNLLILNSILTTICLAVIAYKSAHPLWWLAFIPLANIWLMLDMAQQPLWLIVGLFIPYLQYAVLAWLWMKISENTNKSEWLGLLMIVPIVNMGVACYMAFYEPEEIR